MEIEYLQSLMKSFEEYYQELQLFKKINYQQSNTEIYCDYVFKLECSLDFVQLEAQMRIDHLAAKGIYIKDIMMGLVDFPAILEGEEVLLCWKQGESRIRYYHGRHEGFAGRKELEQLDG